MVAPTYGPGWSAAFRRADDTELRTWLEFALACCDIADELALASFRTQQRVEAKSDGSFVTEADRTIEQTIRGRLADRFPGHGVVGEEFGVDSGSSDVRWFLDPIDGTHNFMRSIPLFGTLLAAERDGEIQVGVVSAPGLGQRWFASRGEGAWALEPGRSAPRQLRVSPATTLGEAQLLFRSVTDMRASRVAGGFDDMLSVVWRERGFGDFWGYALVADGAAEALVEQDLGPWDMAAPWLLVEEAGGRVTDFDGNRTFGRGESVATNGSIHDAVLDCLWQRGGAHVERPPAR